MNWTLAATVLEKGLRALPIIIELGGDVLGTIERLRAVAKAAAEGGTVSDEELAALEADLDATLDEFNAPLPPK